MSLHQQIKEALSKATNKGKWKHNGNEFVGDNLRVGIGGFLSDEDNELVQLLVTNAQQLLDELEKVKEEIKRLSTCQDCGGSGVVEMCDDPYYAEPCVCMVDWMSEAIMQSKEVKRLKSEHAAMKETLKWYADESNYCQPKPFYKPFIEVDRGERARAILSTLSKEEQPNE